MKFVKKILSALIICTMLVPSVALAEYNEVSDIQPFSLGEDYSIGLFSSDIELTDLEKELLNTIVDQLANRGSEITLKAADYGITNYERYYEIAGKCLAPLLQYEHPELFYIDLSGIYFDATVNSITGQAVDLNVHTTTTYKDEDGNEFTVDAYTMDKKTEAAKQAMIDAEYEKIKSMLDEDMTTVQKILTVHDYIVANYEYDMSVFTDSANAIRTLDKMVEQKKGVCQGYSYLFKYVLDKLNAEYDLDIECVTVPSTTCNHMWNKVKLDGEWYNIDVTHDDPTPNESANINHSHFLINDEEIKLMPDNEHTSWDPYKWDGTPVEVSDSTNFYDSVLQKIPKQTIYKNGVFYCFDNKNNICTVDFDKNRLTPVYTDTSRYKWNIGDNYYYSNFSVMTLYNGDIYFNAPNSVFRYDPKSNTAERVYSAGEKDTDIAHIYGLTIKDNKINIEYAENYRNSGISALIPISVNQKPEPEMPCSSEIKPSKDEDGNLMVTVTVNIPEEYTASSTVYVVEYDINGVLTGIHEVGVPFAPDSDTAQVKAFIWGNGNAPLADAASYLIPQTE